MAVELSPIVLTGVRGSGEILMNGGAAFHAKKGDEIHILSYCRIEKEKGIINQLLFLLTKIMS